MVFGALALCLLITVLFSRTLLGVRTLADIEREQPLGPQDLPSLSIIIAARNEERHLATALRSVLSLRYPRLEVCVVDDRSTDRTSQILAELALEYPQLKNLRVETLPSGWLGKNHALHLAAKQAQGEFLLFTDADVVFDSDVLAKVFAYQRRLDLDHLALLVRIDSRSFVTRQFIGFFGMNFMGFFQPWKARDPKSKSYIGIGAFNLLRKSVYQKINGHAPIALRPDDDVKLGKLVKEAGFRQDAAICVREIRVEWYASFLECMRGLEKNAFAGLDYRLGLAAFGVIATLMFFVAPPLVALLSTGPSAKICTLIWLETFVVNGLLARRMGSPFLSALSVPLTAPAFAFVVARNVVKNLYDGGIWWRDTFYSLKELRSNKV